VSGGRPCAAITTGFSASVLFSLPTISNTLISVFELSAPSMKSPPTVTVPTLPTVTVLFRTSPPTAKFVILFAVTPAPCINRRG
jgi:hypothetical protein